MTEVALHCNAPGHGSKWHRQPPVRARFHRRDKMRLLDDLAACMAANGVTRRLDELLGLPVAPPDCASAGTAAGLAVVLGSHRGCNHAPLQDQPPASSFPRRRRCARYRVVVSGSESPSPAPVAGAPSISAPWPARVSSWPELGTAIAAKRQRTLARDSSPMRLNTSGLPSPLHLCCRRLCTCASTPSSSY